MEFKLEAEVVPGAYRARFLGIGKFDGNDEYGPAVKLTWQLLEGPCAGQQVDKICSTRFSTKSNLGKFAAAIRGGAVQVGETFDFAQYTGVGGVLLLEANENGFARVASFIRPEQSPVQQWQQPIMAQAPPQQFQQPQQFAMQAPAPAGNGSIQGHAPNPRVLRRQSGEEFPF